MRFRLPTLGVLLLTAAVAAAAGPVGEYTVGPEDVIEVKVFGEEDLLRTSPVSEKGTLNLGLLGEVVVNGLTAAQIEEKLEKLYEADYLKNPQVFVTIQTFRSKPVQVLGAVKNPNVFRLTGKANVLDILSLAGGISEAGGKKLILLRPVPGVDGVKATVDPITVDVHRLLNEGDTSQNLEVKGGDVVFVPRGDEVYVLGEVRNPGSLKFEEGMTLTQAISKTNGFTKTASKGKVQVVRVEDEKKTQFDVNVKRIEAGKEIDFVLHARDLVVVPESIF